MSVFAPRSKGAPRNKGAKTGSFYGGVTKRHPPASVRVRQLSAERSSGQVSHHLDKAQSYSRGERLSDRCSVLLETDSGDSDPEQDENAYCGANRMYDFEGPQSQPSQPLSGSSYFNTRQASASNPGSSQTITRDYSGSNLLQGDTSVSGQQQCQVNTPAPEQPNIHLLLQEQQVLLMKVLNQQDELKKAQSNFGKRMDNLESQVTSIVRDKTPTSSSSSPTNELGIRLKRVVTKNLSVKVSTIHENLENGFKPQESSTSEHNKAIKSRIMKEIQKATGSFSREQIVVAVRRKYEALRRQWLADGREDENPEETTRRKKFRQRLHRKFDNRKSVIRDEELKYWEQLSLDYMTEESDDASDPNCIVEHKLPWRSSDLNRFMRTLDSRYSETTSREGGTVAKKVRKEGSPSSKAPPVDAPEWTVDEAYLDQNLSQ